MNFHVRKADRGQAKPLIALYGQSGSGKTMSSLLLARGFSPKGRVIMVETEAGRGEAYVDLIDGGYEVVSIRNDFSPKNFGLAITVAEEANPDAVIIDSASAEWSGAGGVLSMAADNQAKGMKGVLVWQAPKMSHQRDFVLRLLQTAVPLVILNLRARFPMVEKKVGDRKEWVRSEQLEPDQATDILFEMFVHGWIDQDHKLHVTKYTRPDLAQVIRDNEAITIDTGRRLAVWARGVEEPAPSSQPTEERVATTGGDGAGLSSAADHSRDFEGSDGGPLPLEQQAYKAAAEGRVAFGQFYHACSREEQAFLRKIKAKIEAHYPVE